MYAGFPHAGHGGVHDEKEDVAVLFSYSGATKDTIHVAEVAKKAGAKIICVTRFVKSPLTSYADLVLLCGANEGPLQGGSTSAEISQLFLIDLMYSEYYRRYFVFVVKITKKLRPLSWKNFARWKNCRIK